MELFEEKIQNLSDSQVADTIKKLLMSTDFLRMLDEYISANIVKGKYDEAISIRQRIVRGRFVIA